MSTISVELDQALLELDTESAAKLEGIVRDVLALSRSGKQSADEEANSWPPGYFEKTAGCFAGEPLDPPHDPPPEAISNW